MYQQATEILPFAATLWKDVKFNDIRLQPLLFYVVFLFLVCFGFHFALCLRGCFHGLCAFLCMWLYFHFLFSCSQFLMFELARSGNGSAIQEILVNSRHIGVDLEDFLNTLLGK